MTQLSAHQRILLIELWGIGDATLLTSALRGLLADGAEVTVLAKASTCDLLQSHYPGITTIEFDAPWTAFYHKYQFTRWPWAKLFRLIAHLRRQRFDAATSVRPDPRDHLLMWLAGVRRRVDFEIFGPEEDAATARRCRELAAALPAHVKVVWRGAARNDEIVAALGRSDIFVSPTGGENFGHAIFEALACGVPALISDRTPWRGLEARQAGWDLPLDGPDRFAEALERYAALAPAERAAWREGARRCASAYVESSGAAALSAALIRRALK